MTNIRSFAGQRPQIDSSAWIDESVVVIGDVEIGPQSSVWPMCVVRGDIHSIRIGAMTNIQDSCVLHVSHDSRFLAGGAPLVIGDQVTVGHQAVLHGCEVGESCLVGIGARVLDQAVLEPLTMLGAGPWCRRGGFWRGATCGSAHRPSGPGRSLTASWST